MTNLQGTSTGWPFAAEAYPSIGGRHVHGTCSPEGRPGARTTPSVPPACPQRARMRVPQRVPYGMKGEQRPTAYAPPPPDNGVSKAIVTNRLGTIQRRIRRAFIAKSGAHLSTGDLVRWCYPRLKGRALSKRHFCVRRAAERVAVRTGRRVCPGGFVWKAKSDGI